MKKAIVLSVAAAMLVAALTGAGSASAASFNFESSPSWVKGERALENFWTSNGGFIKTATSTFKGEELLGASAASITLHPEYSGVTMAGSPASGVTTGCDFVFTASSTTAGSAVISCSGTHKIVFKQTSSGCTIFFSGETATT